jgi:hypothetical protein
MGKAYLTIDFTKEAPQQMNCPLDGQDKKLFQSAL